MEYILTEILKNSFRATVEHQHKQHPDAPTSQLGSQSQSQSQSQHHPLPPVLITIVPPPRLPGLTKPATLSLRIRDQGGGVSPTNMSRIFSYAFTTAGRRARASTRSGSHSHSHGHGRGYGGAAASRDADEDEDVGAGGGPYAAQYIGGAAAVGSGMGPATTAVSGSGSGGVDLGGAGLFGEITGKGVETGLGTIAGLGFGLPMSRLYAR
jgi:26S proteasome regulatory subunit T1